MKGMMFIIVGSRTHLIGLSIAHEAQLTGLECSLYHVALCARVKKCSGAKAAMRDADAQGKCQFIDQENEDSHS